VERALHFFVKLLVGAAGFEGDQRLDAGRVGQPSETTGDGQIGGRVATDGGAQGADCGGRVGGAGRYPPFLQELLAALQEIVTIGFAHDPFLEWGPVPPVLRLRIPRRLRRWRAGTSS